MRALLALVLVASCYDVPQPECGFQCGVPVVEGGAGSCPDGYTCLADRCRLVSDLAFDCPAFEPPPELSGKPRVQASEPASAAIDIALDTSIRVTFTKDVRNVTPRTFYVLTNGDQVTGNLFEVVTGRHYEFQPHRLFPNRTYDVVLTAAIEDLDGRELEPVSWMFSTVRDLVAPRVTGSSPPNGATLGSLTTPLHIGFDEDIVGVTPASAYLERGGVVVPTTLSMPSAQTIRLDHDPLAGSSTYSIILTSGITDLYGNPLAATTITFTTRDTTPPMVTSRLPLPGAIDVPLDAHVVVGFTEPVTFDVPDFQLLDDTLTSVPIDYDFGINGDVIVLIPMAPLAASTTYTVRLTSNVTDLENNRLTPESWTFTTVP